MPVGRVTWAPGPRASEVDACRAWMPKEEPATPEALAEEGGREEVDWERWWEKPAGGI